MPSGAAASLKRWLGLFLFALALYFILLSKRIRIERNVRSGILVGALSGVGDKLPRGLKQKVPGR